MAVWVVPCPMPEDDVNDPQAAEMAAATGFGPDAGCEFAEPGTLG